MTAEEPWDAKKVAAECAKTARAKTGPKPSDPALPPPIPTTSKPSGADEYRDELGHFKAGHPLHPGSPILPSVSKYKPEYVDQVRRLAQIGATNEEMAQFFEVRRSTFQLWMNVYPDFNEAVKLGKEKPDDRTERSMYEVANGYDYVEEQPIKLRDSDGNERIEIVKVQRHQPPDVRAGTLWLINRRPHDWQVKKTIEHTPGERRLSPDEARKALADYYANQPGQIIDVTPTRLALPDPEGAIIAEDDI